ncbi:hypothetical protein, partial [Micromonospora aurantiaca]|uniref:hypothetical protein n=1 Tax=Micromonospora aurantiaca (nom. illeg.) TaxID=47850 RepID=UPI00197C5512
SVQPRTTSSPTAIRPWSRSSMKAGVAHFAIEYRDDFHRIEAVAQMEDKTLRVLDLTNESVRKAVYEAEDAEQLYLSYAASNY